MRWPRTLTAALIGVVALSVWTEPVWAAHIDGSYTLQRKSDAKASGCKVTMGRATRVANDGAPAKRFVRVTARMQCDKAYERAHWSVVIRGGVSWEHPHNWDDYGDKGWYHTRWDAIPVGITRLHAAIECNHKKADGTWAYPTTKMGIFGWNEVHSPAKTSKDNWYVGATQDWLVNVRC
jgi:hypothetical protein